MARTRWYETGPMSPELTGPRESRGPSEARVLVVDDDQDNLDAFGFTFRHTFDVQTASSGAEALKYLRDHDVAVVVCDQRMPGMLGLEVLRLAHELRPEAVGILVTAYADFDVLVSAINGGYVYRYVPKPWDAKELGLVISQAMERHALLRENRTLVERLQEHTRYLQDELGAQFDFGEILGESTAMKEIMAQVGRVAPTRSTVLLRGASGTGKELVSRAIHMNSPRAEKPYVRVNCAALASGVLESELFGHEKGSFTGALARRLGRFEIADGGTIFLDEIGDLPMETQIKLLRVLQEREFERVGGTETVRVDVRVISATNRDLEALLDSGAFREDLYYRINVFPIHLPPLTERPEDIALLARHFVQKLARRTGKKRPTLDEAVMSRLREYDWPGNVRELENVIERALILCDGEKLRVADLAFGMRGRDAGRAQNAPAAPGTRPTPEAGEGMRKRDAEATARPESKPQSLGQELEDVERARLLAALEKHGGRKSDAARELGINRSTLYYRLKKVGLE